MTISQLRPIRVLHPFMAGIIASAIMLTPILGLHASVLAALTNAEVVSVSPDPADRGQTLTVKFRSTVAGTPWNGTIYRFGGGEGGWSCLNSPNHATNGTYTETFPITAPNSYGYHLLEIAASSRDDCETAGSYSDVARHIVQVGDEVPVPSLVHLNTDTMLPLKASAVVNSSITTRVDQGIAGYRYSFDGGATWSACMNQFSDRYFDVLAPNTPGSLSLQVESFQSSSCAAGSSMGISPNFPAITVSNAPTDNPGVSPVCGIDIVMVLDESSSIFGNRPGTLDIRTEMRSAAKELVSGLSGTGSYLNVIEFATVARQSEIGGSTGFQLIDSGYESTFTDYIDANISGEFPAPNRYEPADNAVDQNDKAQDFTSWEDALNEVLTVGVRAGSGRIPLVLFLTDGNPTTRIGNEYLSSARVGESVAAAAPLASMIKTTQGSHIMVIGFPNPTLIEGNVAAISGPNQWPDKEPNIATADYVIAPDVEELSNALKALVSQLCGASVQVTTLLDGDNNPATNPVPAAGWTLRGDTDVPDSGGAKYIWKLPNDAVPPGSTASGATNANGRVSFAWQLQPLTAIDDSKIIVTQAPTTVQNNLFYLSEISCPVQAPGSDFIPSIPNKRFTLDAIQKSSASQCRFVNTRKPALTALCRASDLEPGQPGAEDPYIEGKLQNTDTAAQANGWNMTIELPVSLAGKFKFEGGQRYTSTPAGVCTISDLIANCSLNDSVLPAGEEWTVQVYMDQLVTEDLTFDAAVSAVSANNEPYQTKKSDLYDTCNIDTEILDTGDLLLPAINVK